MKPIKFPQADRIDPQGNPIAFAVDHPSLYKAEQTPAITKYTVYKYALTKEEIKALHKNKEIYLLLPHSGSTPVFAFRQPYDAGYIVTDNHIELDLNHTLQYKGHQFTIILSRKFINSRVKLRNLRVVIDGAYVKDGKLPDIASRKERWLKDLLDICVADVEKASTPIVKTSQV